jgi:hypothetical protein
MQSKNNFESHFKACGSLRISAILQLTNWTETRTASFTKSRTEPIRDPQTYEPNREPQFYKNHETNRSFIRGSVRFDSTRTAIVFWLHLFTGKGAQTTSRQGGANSENFQNFRKGLNLTMSPFHIFSRRNFLGEVNLCRFCPWSPFHIFPTKFCRGLHPLLILLWASLFIGIRHVFVFVYCARLLIPF